MAGTVTISETGIREGLSRIDLVWISDSDGDATLTTDRITGTIERITFKPSTVSGSEPSASYDVTLTDDFGVDVLLSQGANLSASTVSNVVPTGGDTALLPFATSGPLDLAVSNAGDTASGIVSLYFRR